MFASLRETRRIGGTLAVAAIATVVAIEPRLTSEAITGWERYVGATELRIAQELGARDRFLATDFEADAPARRAAILGGAVLVDEHVTRDHRGAEIEAPGAMVHHWRGAVLIPGERLSALMARLQAGPPRPGQQEDVLDAKLIERSPDRLRVYLRLQRTKFVTVVFNTEHDIRFKRHGPTRASSASTAVKIAEVQNAGTPSERELIPGDDRGFLWRLNSYWRYEEVPAGVIAECESISLSRDVPSVVHYIAAPLIRSTASESMERTLRTLKKPA